MEDNPDNNAGNVYIEEVPTEIVQQIEKGKEGSHTFDGNSVTENSQQLMGSLSVMGDKKREAKIQLFGKCRLFRMKHTTEEYLAVDWKNTKNSWINYEQKKAKQNYHTAQCLRNRFESEDPDKLQEEFNRHEKEAIKRHVVFRYRRTHEAVSEELTAAENAYVLKSANSMYRQRLVRQYEPLELMLDYLYKVHLDGCFFDNSDEDGLDFYLIWKEEQKKSANSKKVCRLVMLLLAKLTGNLYRELPIPQA